MNTQLSINYKGIHSIGRYGKTTGMVLMGLLTAMSTTVYAVGATDAKNNVSSCTEYLAEVEQNMASKMPADPSKLKPIIMLHLKGQELCQQGKNEQATSLLQQANSLLETGELPKDKSKP